MEFSVTHILILCVPNNQKNELNLLKITVLHQERDQLQHCIVLVLAGAVVKNCNKLEPPLFQTCDIVFLQRLYEE